MGFGRIGKMFVCEYVGIEFDMMCIVKGLLLGYYLIVMFCIIIDIFNVFYVDYKEGKFFLYFYIYLGNLLGCRIVLEVLRIFKEENILKIINEKGIYFRNKMKEIFEDKFYIKDIRNIGFIGVIELKDNFFLNVRIGKEIYNFVLKKGVFLRFIGNSVYFMFFYVIIYEEIDKMFYVCKEFIEEFLKI